MGFLVVLGLTCTWTVWRAYRQVLAIRDIQAAWGRVDARPTGPAWLRLWIGSDWARSLSDVNRVDLAYGAVPDSSLRRLTYLSGFKELYLTNSGVKDGQLGFLSN